MSELLKDHYICILIIWAVGFLSTFFILKEAEKAIISSNVFFSIFWPITWFYMVIDEIIDWYKRELKPFLDYIFKYNKPV